MRDLEGEYLRLNATTYSGVAPLETTLRVDSSMGFSSATFSCTGPEEIEVLDDSVPEERRVRFPAEGIYQCTAVVKDTQGLPHSDTIMLNVQSRNAIDGLLRAKWDGMKRTLAGGEIEAALEYFSGRTRDQYRMIFGELSRRLPEIVSQMEDIEMILCRDDAAEYRIERNHLVNGQPVAITYSVFFGRDEKGLWKIDKF